MNFGRFARTFKVVLVITILASAQLASAALLAPGGTIAPDNTASPTGANQLATLTDPFTSLDLTSFSGSLTTTVYNQDPNNANGPNALTFVYILRNNANSQDPLQRLVVNDYAGFSVNASLSTVTPGSNPLAVDRSNDGSLVGWDWTTSLGLAPGGVSSLMVIRSNATQFVPTVDAIINGSVATADSYSPLIPEPASATICGLGSVAPLAFRRRK